MRNNLLLSALSICMFCAPPVYGAASSGLNAHEHYQSALHGLGINSIVTAFLTLPVHDQRKGQYLVPLIEALKKEKLTDNGLIDGLAITFSAHSPLIKWLRSTAPEPSLALIAYLEELEASLPVISSSTASSLDRRITEEEHVYPAPIAPTQKILFADADPDQFGRSYETGLQRARHIPSEEAFTYQAAEPIPEPLPRRNISTLQDLARKALAQGPLVEAIVQNPIKRARPWSSINPTSPELEIISPALVQEADIQNVIDDLPTRSDMRQEVYEASASLIAHDQYLALCRLLHRGVGETNLKKIAKDAFAALPPFLQTHFKGVSIQDLIDENLLPSSEIIYAQTTLDLSELFISDLKGLKNIPGITSLEELNLDNNQIATVAPYVFANLSGLKLLTLENNQITIIAQHAFAGLDSLNALYLDNNQITTITPYAFANLSDLMRLSLTGNQIATLAPNAFIDLTSLKELYLDHNQISAIALNTFAGLDSLRELHLNSNQITIITPNAFADLNALELLELSSNLIPIIASNEFVGLNNLTILSLDHNRITTIAPSAFTGLNLLRELYLHHNQITAIAQNTFADLGSLRELHLDNNQIPAIALNTFAGLDGLNALYLDNNQITTIAPRTFANLRDLMRLSLTGNQITIIAQHAFTGLDDLEALCLNNNQITTINPHIFDDLNDLNLLLLYDNQITQPEQQRISSRIQAIAPNVEVFFSKPSITSIRTYDDFQEN